MWNPEGQLVQILIGRSVLDAATRPDNRNVIKKWFGNTTPKHGEILVQGYAQLQKNFANEKVFLPNADMSQTDSLPADHVLIYFGVERRQFPIRSLDDIANYLHDKAKDYAVFSPDRPDIQHALAAALEGVTSDYGGTTLERLSRAYFWSSAQTFDPEAVLALGYAGNLGLRALDTRDATLFLIRAVQLAERTNTIEPDTVAALCNDAGCALRFYAAQQITAGAADDATHSLGLAKQCYRKAISICSSIDDQPRLFFALCGCAGACYAQNELDVAEHWLEQAFSMTSDASAQRDLQAALRIIAKQQTQQMQQINEVLLDRLKEAETELEKNKFFNKLCDFVLPIFLHVSIGLIYGGAGLLGKTIKLSNVTLNGPSVIGYKNLQRVFA